ncbi:hypothetical protein FPV67DRAFT_784034 [Lyophyllum atratum]|nr:hypothetical protein FPV67DRAFT_784034 [Lyophyllum atratum]
MPGSTYPSSSHMRDQLLTATDHFLTAFASNKTHPLTLLSHFSTTWPTSIQHYPSTCSHPQSSLLRGANAIRSYFDLLATHWTRSCVVHRTLQADISTRTVVFEGNVTWTWKKSGRSWVEDFTCTLAFDELLKIVSFSVRTDSEIQTCVMRAKDVDNSSPLLSMLATSGTHVAHRVSVRRVTCPCSILVMN